MSNSKNTFDTLPPHETLALDPAVIQAVWRCMLGGNDHWVGYWSSDTKHSGLNDRQASLGRITRNGKDYRHRAGEPYNFTVAIVDAKRIGFGVWTRSSDDQHPLYAHACWDFEPLKRPTKRAKSGEGREEREPSGGTRIVRDPTPKHQLRVYREAEACYDDILGHYTAARRLFPLL